MPEEPQEAPARGDDDIHGDGAIDIARDAVAGGAPARNHPRTGAGETAEPGPDAAPADDPGADEPMTNEPLPLAEESPGVGLSRSPGEADEPRSL